MKPEVDEVESQTPGARPQVPRLAEWDANGDGTGDAHPDRPQLTEGAANAHGTGDARPSRPQRGRREELLRAELEPLGEHERPPALLVAIAVCGLLALAVIFGVATDRDLRTHGGSVPGGIFLAIVFVSLSAGMYRRRYWAVLGFEALLAFQILVTSLALVVASTILAASICIVSIGLGGWLFWKLIRVMGRIQAQDRQAL
jgi:hypothetical protein